MRPTAAPAAAPPAPDAPPAPLSEAEQMAKMEREMEQISIARQGLRALGAQAQRAIADPRIETCTLPAVLVEALFGVAITALDGFLDERVVDEQGVRSPLPDSLAAMSPQAVLRLVQRVVEFGEKEEPAVRPPTRQERRALERMAAKGLPIPSRN